MVSKVKKNKDNDFNNLMKEALLLSKLNAIVSSAYQYKNTENIVSNKTSNVENVIIYGINDINSKVLENKKKFEDIEENKNDLLNKYKDALNDIGTNFDNIITMGYVKLLEEDLVQLEKYNEIYKLKGKEIKARAKLDNSDDEIAEIIYEKEDEISKSEAKARRLKTTINAKIKEKQKELNEAMETEEKEIQTKIKGPQIFKGAKKFFFGRINPRKMIENNVFSDIRERINKFNEEKLKELKRSKKYNENNLIESVEVIIEEKSKNILSNDE